MNYRDPRPARQLDSPKFVFSLKSPRQSANELMERSQLLLINQIEFLDKVHEVFEAGVDVGLLSQHHDLNTAVNNLLALLALTSLKCWW